MGSVNFCNSFGVRFSNCCMNIMLFYFALFLLLTRFGGQVLDQLESLLFTVTCASINIQMCSDVSQVIMPASVILC